MFVPENNLESILVQAKEDPEARPQFYAQLMGSDIFFVNEEGEPSENTGGNGDSPGTRFAIRPVQQDGEDWLPIFTAVSRLQQVIEHDVTCVQFNAYEFFQMTRGANIVLNPGLDIGKTFPAEEIQWLLDEAIEVHREEEEDGEEEG